MTRSHYSKRILKPKGERNALLGPLYLDQITLHSDTRLKKFVVEHQQEDCEDSDSGIYKCLGPVLLIGLICWALIFGLFFVLLT